MTQKAGHESTTPLLPEVGNSFKTHKLVSLDLRRMVFRPSGSMRVVVGILTAIGVFGMSYYAVFSTATGETVIGFVIGLSFLIAGLLVGLHCRGIVFDRSRRIVSKFDHTSGWPDLSFHRKEFSLNEVTSLQIVRKYVEGGIDSEPFYSFELNLVYRDGNRMNILPGHGHLPSLQCDAQCLAEFLDVPLSKPNTEDMKNQPRIDSR